MDFRLSAHALKQLTERSISRDVLEAVLEAPQQVVPAHGGLRAYPSQLELQPGRIYLVRAIVAGDAEPPIVVTVCRTRKVAKYWRAP